MSAPTAPAAPTTIWVTPNTHWDREWVMTQGQFQSRLVDLIDEVLALIDRHPEYRFFLDGQAIVLEDYLEIKPEKRAEITAALAGGRLSAGPYYVLADQFLPGAEAVVRNLLFGRRVVRELGGEPVGVGYAPDAFGVGASFPSVLAGFGLRYGLFGRGHQGPHGPIQHNEFWWEGPDGARVLAAGPGYAQAVFMSYPDIWQNIDRIAPEPAQTMKSALAHAGHLKSHATSGQHYFPVGIDHMRPSPTLPGILEFINARQADYKFVFGTPEDYFAAVEAAKPDLAVYRGEMRGSDEAVMDLVGTLSSHVRLKQANHRCETRLARQLEPLAVLVEALGGRAWPAGLLRQLWRRLLMNHPHDSICGCSVDQVHADMMNRYEHIEATSDYLIKDWLHSLTSRIDTRGPAADDVALVVVNPLGLKHSGPVRALARVERRFAAGHYQLVDAVGQPVPARIRRVAMKQQDLESVYMTNSMLATVLSKTPGPDHPADQVYTVLEVDFVAEDVPSFGYKTWWLREVNEVKEEAPIVQTTPAVRLLGEGSEINDTPPAGMENEFLRVTFNANGTFDLLDQRTGQRHAGLGCFLDREEIGNGYDHHSWPAPDERNTLMLTATVRPVEVFDHRVTVAIDLPWALPVRVEGERRSADLLPYPITVYATLYAGLPRLEITIELENNAKDHCLRLAFDTGLDAPSVAAGDVFHVIDRPLSKPGAEWRDQPMQDFVDVADAAHGLCVLAKGLYAYEAFPSPAGIRLEVTLLRAFGQMGPAAGANHPMPAAQMPGRHRFELALMPHPGDWREGGNNAADCVTASRRFTTAFLAEAALPHPGDHPAELCLLDLQFESTLPPPLATCLKQAEDGRGVIFRLWNPGEAQFARLRGPIPESRHLYRTNLAEDDAEPLSDAEINLPAHGVATVRMIS